MIYFQTTPMTESLFIFLLIAVAYFFLKWINKGDITQLMGCGFFSFLLVLHRYEGWLTLLITTLAVGLWTLYKKKSLKQIESTLIIYLTIAGFGLVLFFGAQYLILGSPIYFLTSPYAAKAHADEIASGLFHTMGSIPKSVLTYWWAVTTSGGFLLTLLTTISLPLLTIISIMRKSFNILFVIAILISPFVFQVLVLYLGKVPLQVPQLEPSGTINIRYGLYSFPLLVVIIGLVINQLSRFNILRYLVIFLILIMTLVLSIKSPPPLIAHADFDETAKNSKLLKQFKNNYNGGLVLISTGAFDPFMYYSGLPLKTFISDGSYKYWQESLIDPAKYADWVIVSGGNHPRDLLAVAVRENPNLLNNFYLIYEDRQGSIYKRK